MKPKHSLVITHEPVLYYTETTLFFYLSDFGKARGVNGSLGDGDCVPALILGRTTTAWGVRAPTSPDSSPSTHPAARTATHLLLGDEGLLHFHVLPVLLQLGLFVDLVYRLGALVSSSWNPVVLGWN